MLLFRWRHGGVDNRVPGRPKALVNIDIDNGNTFFHMVKDQIIEKELQCFEGI